VKVHPTGLPGLLLIEPRLLRDERGHFLESWSRERYAAHGIPADFAQDNVSRSARGVVRGLHLQSPPHAQGKLVSVLEGEVFDVAVDARVGSPSFGRWAGFTLSAENGRQLFIPEGFAHGFMVTSAEAVFHYKCTRLYAPQAELTVRWDDPALAIDWPALTPLLCDRDRLAPRLDELPEERLSRHG
jgi:dTDP-4-dehydrorhamnose 3,5-epimerase